MRFEANQTAVRIPGNIIGNPCEVTLDAADVYIKTLFLPKIALFMQKSHKNGIFKLFKNGKRWSKRWYETGK